MEQEQAALDALGDLALQQQGASAVLLHPSQLVQDVASKALGRAPSPDITLAALHALATLAGQNRALITVWIWLHHSTHVNLSWSHQAFAQSAW